MNPNPDPTPSASGDFLPIASYDRALHGEWVEGRWGDTFDLSTTRFNEGKWWVGRDNPRREIEVPTPSHFRPIPTPPPNFPDLFRAQHPVATPPASGETAAREEMLDRAIALLATSAAPFDEACTLVRQYRALLAIPITVDEVEREEWRQEKERLTSALAASRAECEALEKRYEATIAELKNHELLASGYHMRTEREVELEMSLEGRDPLTPFGQSIKDLLAICDAGRNRVHLAETKAEELTSALTAANLAREKAEGRAERAEGELEARLKQVRLDLSELDALRSVSATVADTLATARARIAELEKELTDLRQNQQPNRNAGV